MAATMSNSPLFWRRVALMPLLSAVDLPALHGAPTPGIQCHGRTAALQDRWEMEGLFRPATRLDQRPTHRIIHQTAAARWRANAPAGPPWRSAKRDGEA